MQRAVAVDGRVYVSFLTDDTHWTLMASAGKGWQTIDVGTVSDPKAPTVETDGRNVFTFRHDPPTGTIEMRRYPGPTVWSFQGQARTPKFATIYDPGRDSFYFMNHGGYLYRFSPAGSLLGTQRILYQNGPLAQSQYPHVALDGPILHFGWTSQGFDGAWHYRSVHHARSADLTNWTKADGAPLTVPFIADETGPADEVTLAGEHARHNFLSSMAALNGRVAFTYQSYPTPPDPVGYFADRFKGYQRVTLLAADGRKDLYGLGDILNLDGFFARDGDRLFFVGLTRTRKIGVYKGDPSLERWDLVGESQPLACAYAISGARSVTNGKIVGVVTDLGPDCRGDKSVLFIDADAK